MPELSIGASTLVVRNEAVVDQYGQSYSASVPLYAGYEAVRKDLSPTTLKRGLTITNSSDLEAYGPIDPRNKLIFGAYAVIQGMQLAPEDIPFRILGVESDDLPGFMATESVLKRDTLWMPIALTNDENINEWLGNLAITSDTPTTKRDWSTLLTYSIPTESFPSTIGTGLAAATNTVSTEFVVDLDKFNVGASMLAAVPPLDPAAVVEADGLYIKISGGGADDLEASYKWAVTQVVVATNTIVVTISPADNDDGFFTTEAIPEVTNATITLFVRGSAITDGDDQATSLQGIADVFENRRVCICPSDGYDAPDVNGSTTRLANYFGTAALAGYIQTHTLMNPISGWDIPWLERVYGTDENFEDIDSITKLFTLVNMYDDVGNVTGVLCGMDFTSDASTTKNHRFTVGAATDALALRIRKAVSTWKKLPTTLKSANDLFAKVQAAGLQSQRNMEVERFDLSGINFGADTNTGEIDAIDIYGAITHYVPVGKVFIYISD